MQNILKNTYYLLFVITIGVILTILLSNKIPIEIDEHIQYWTFGCNYYNSANKSLIYHNECHHLDLALLKDFFHKSPCSPLRSYNYLGTISNIFYIPCLVFLKKRF